MSNDVEVMNALLDKIYGVIGEHDPINGRQGREAYVSFTRPGIPITPESLSFGFLTSTVKEADAAAGFADLANIVPTNDPFWQPSSRRVFDEYWRCVDQPILPVVSLTEAEKKRLADAKAVLETEVTRVDDLTGEIVRATTDSPLYERYRAREITYLSALNAYNEAFATYIGRKDSDPTAEMIWLQSEPTLSARVRAAYNHWVAAGKAQIEGALDTRDGLERRNADTAFAAYRRRYADHQRSIGAQGVNYLFTKYFPDRFWEHPDNWTNVRYRHDEVHKVDESRLERIGGGGGAGFGLWSFGGSLQRNTQDDYRRADTSNFAVSFSLAKVPIRRSWFNGSVLRSRNWAFDYDVLSRALNLSDGKGGGTMPMLPVAMLVARDLRVDIAMTSETNRYAMKEISGSARAGWGPFSIRGNYYSKETKQTHDYLADDRGLEVKGMQIIGFVLERVPKCPDPDKSLNWPQGVSYEDIDPDVQAEAEALAEATAGA